MVPRKTSTSACSFALVCFIITSCSSPFLVSTVGASLQHERKRTRAQRARRAIINGQDADADAHRWFATMLRTVKYYDFSAQEYKQGLDWAGCSGSLIAPHWIVTAAHCLPNAEVSDMVWRIGFRGFCPASHHPEVNCGLEYADVGVDEVFAHEYVDVGLIRLKEAAPSTIVPVRVDSDGTATASLQTGDEMVVLGTGKVSMTAKQGQPNVLQQATVRFDSNDDVCHEQLGTDLLHPLGFICSAAEDVDEEEVARTCYGDSGGPLIIQERTAIETRSDEDVLIGVVAVGDPWCRKNVAGFAELFYVRDWICETMCGEEHWNKNSRRTKKQTEVGKEDEKDKDNSVAAGVASDCPSWCGGGEDADEAAAGNVQPNE